jgi:RHS repeat-associated protein
MSATDAPNVILSYASALSPPATVFHCNGNTSVSHVFGGGAGDAFPTTALTLAFWVNTADTSVTATLFAFTPSGATAPKLTVTNPVSLTITWQGAAPLVTGCAINDGQWHHVLITVAPNGRTFGAVQLVLDGVPRLQAPKGCAHAASDWFVAAGTLALGMAGTGSGFTGSLSEFELWSVALDDAHAATRLQRAAPSGTPDLALVWALYDTATAGTLAGADPNPFIPSTLQFRAPAAGQTTFVQATWTPVTGATAYDFEIYALDGSWVQVISNIAASSLPLNLEGVLLDQSYQARARSRDGSGAGAWSTPVALTPIDLNSVTPLFSWPAVSGAATANWQPPDQNQSYLLLQTRDPLQTPAPVAAPTTATSVDVAADLTGDYGWTVGVQGVSAGSIGPVASAGSVAAPPMIFYYVDDGQGVQGSGSFEFAWPTPTSPPTYLYFMVSKAGTPVLTQLLPGTQASPARFPSPQPIVIGDQLTGVMRTLGNAVITHVATRTVTAQDVATPQLTWQIAVAPQPEALVAAWAAVAPGATYNLALYQDAGSIPIVVQKGASALSFPMTTYLSVDPPHAYTLNVSAVLNGQVGPASTVVAPPALASTMTYVWTGAPTNAGVLSLSWTPVATQGLQVFLRLFMNGATTPSLYDVVPFSAGTYPVSQPAGGYPEGAQFSYRAYGLGAGDLAPPEIGNVTLHRLDQPVVTLIGNAAAGTLTAQWPAVNPTTPGAQYQVLVNGAQLGAPQVATSFDLTSRLAATTANAFQVVATLDNSFGQPSVASAAPATAPALRYDYALNALDTLSAQWTAAPMVYLQVSLQGQATLVASQLDTAGETTFPVPRPGAGFTEGSVYTLATKAIANGTLGAFAQASATIHQLVAPVVTFASAPDPASVTAQWNDIRNPQQQNLTVNYQVRVNAQSTGAPQTALSAVIAGLLDRAGAQAVTVQGQADGSFGIWSTPTVLAALATPALSYDEVFQALTASWPAATGAQQYYANAMDAQGAIFARSWIGSGAQTVTTTFALPNPVANATYSVNARALAGGTLTPFSTASLVYRVVPGPSITTPMQNDSANHQVVAAWSFDPAACGLTNVVYVAELHDSTGALIGSPVQTSSKTANLPYPANTANGTTLQVRVRATGNGLLGAWSSYASLTLGSGLQKIAITAFSFNAENSMTIAWGAVTSPQPGTAVTYTVTVTGPGLKTGVFPQTTTSTSLQLSQATTGVANKTTYSATVQATAPGTPGEVSAVSTATTGTLTSGDGGGTSTGDPIAIATGAYVYSNADLSVVGVVPLEFATFYSSATPLPDAQNPIASDKPMGKRWSHTYNTRLYIPDTQPATNPFVAVVWGHGSVGLYNWRNAIGTLTKQGRQDGSVLVRNTDLTYTLILKDQSRYQFDATGRLVRLISTVGNTVTLSYSGSQLQRVTDDGSGRYLSLTYFASGADAGRVQQVSDNAGRQISYAYTNGDLATFTGVSGKSRGFTYWPQSLMKQATFENGDVIVYNEYDSQQRVKLQRDGNQMAGGQSAYTITWADGTGPNDLPTVIATVQDYANNQVVYTSLKDSQDTISTVYTLPNGNVRSISATYDGNGNVLSETTYEGPTAGAATLGNTSTAVYDGNFNLVTLTLGGGAATATVGYDSNNNLTSVTDAVGNVTTAQFNADNTLAETRDPLGTRSVYTYKAGAIKGLVETASVYPANGQGGASSTPNVAQMTYPAQGQLETFTNALGETATCTYDAATGQLSSRTVADADGTVTLVTTYLRGPQSARVQTRKTQRYNQPLADASAETFTYDDRGNIHFATDALGRTTEYRYNPNNFLQTIVYPPQGGFSARTIFGYTGDNLINALMLSSASPNVTWAFGYDAVGRLLSRTDPNGNMTMFGYAMQVQQSPAAPSVKSVVFPLIAGASNSYVQSLTEDCLERPVALTDITVQGVTGGTTTLAYATQTDPATGAKVVQITKTLPLVSPTQSPPYTEITVYDASDRVISVTDPAGKLWTTGFSLAVTASPVTVQTVTTATDPLGNQSITVMDAAGRIVQYQQGRPAAGSSPAQWKTTSVTYDSSGNPKQVVETGSDGISLPATTYAYAYDAQEHVLKVTVTPYGKAAAAAVYSYDKAMEYVRLQAPSGITETRTYNSRGLLKSYTDGRGNTLQYEYDAAGRFTTTTLPGGDVIANVLDPNGNRLQTTRNGVPEITRVFDALNRITSRTDNLMAKAVGYTYTPMNRVATLTYPDVATPLAYTYDGWQRINTVTDWSNRTTSYTYWPAGKLQDTTYPNGVLVHQTVDDANRVTGFNATVHGAVIASAAATFDAFSTLQTLDEILPLGAGAPPDRTLTYDGDRLLTADGANLAYDSDGDMTLVPGVSGTLQYNVLRQLTAVGAAALTYDLDGLQTTLVNGATTRRFIKDPRDYRAPLVDLADPARAIRAWTSVTTATGPLALAPLAPPASNAKPLTVLPARPPTLGPEQPDPFECLPVLDADPYGDFENALDRTLVAQNSDGTNRVRYVYGHGLISREEDAGTWQSYVFDGQGSTLALVDLSGTVTDRFAWSPYGAPLARQGTTVDPFRYHGRDGAADFGVGVLLMRFRPYQPGVQRFTTRDMLFGNGLSPQTQNRYAFVLGNPAQRIDPLGLTSDHGGGGGGGLSGGVIAIIAIGSLIGVVVVGAAVYYGGPILMAQLGRQLVMRFGTRFLGRIGLNVLRRFPIQGRLLVAAEEGGVELVELLRAIDGPIEGLADDLEYLRFVGD